MIDYDVEIVHTYLQSDLAAAVRRVNARHRRAGRPELPGLDRCWTRLVRDLRRADAVGDGLGQRQAIQQWEADAVQTIEGSR